MSKSRWFAVLAATTALTAGLGACGSSTGDQPANASAAKLKGSPLRLVVFTAFNSVDPQPEDYQAAEAAADAINAAGGVQGHPIEVSSCDVSSETSPSQSTTCARNLVANSNDLAEIGDQNAFQQQANVILAAANVPNIGPGPASASVLSAKNSFPLEGLEGAAGATVLADAGATKISVAYADVAAAATAVTFNQLALQMGRGLKLLGGIPVPLTATDLSPEVAKAAKGDGVAMAVAPTTVGSWLTAQKQGNYNIKVSVPGAALEPDVLSSLGSNSNGIIAALGLPSVDSSQPGIVKFRQEMSTYEPKARLDEVALNGWLSVWAFAQVAKTISGPITRASVLAAFNNLTDFNVFGLLPNHFSTTKGFSMIPGLNRVFNDEIIEGVVRNQKIVETSNGYVPIFTKPSS